MVQIVRKKYEHTLRRGNRKSRNVIFITLKGSSKREKVLVTFRSSPRSLLCKCNASDCQPLTYSLSSIHMFLLHIICKINSSKRVLGKGNTLKFSTPLFILSHVSQTITRRSIKLFNSFLWGKSILTIKVNCKNKMD